MQTEWDPQALHDLSDYWDQKRPRDKMTSENHEKRRGEKISGLCFSTRLYLC